MVRVRSHRGHIYVPASPGTPTPSGGNRSKSWCFTTNNYAALDVVKLDQLFATDKVEYLVYGKEVGESGTPHLQGYVVFKTRKTLNSARDLLPFGSHLEIALGTPEEAADYCRKDGDFKEFVNLI